MLKEIFQPNSIAVIGASREKGKVGHTVFSNLLTNGYPGDVYPINPGGESILGKKCYKSIRDVPADIDLAVVAIPARFVPAAFDELGETGIPAVVVISAGFKEIGHEGAQLEAQLAEKVARYGMRVLGPNCLGIIDTVSRVNASFAAGMPSSGNIGFFSQSGALGTAILDWALGQNVGFSKFVSLGNKLDIDESDILREMGEDDNTDVILGYIESVNSGTKFLDVARAVTGEKPVIMLKSGGTKAGARAASSHTGALAGSETAFSAAFTQSGIIRVDAIEELFDYARAFSSKRYPRGNRVAIVTNAGGPAIIASDAIENSDLRMANFEKETVTALQEALPPTAAVYNPVDLIGDAREDRYSAALGAVMADPNVDGALVLFAPTAMSEPAKVARVVCDHASDEKPILASFMGGPTVASTEGILSDASVPNYHYPERAIKAMEAMARYTQWRGRAAPETREFEVDKERVRELLAESAGKGRIEIGEHEAREMISAYGFRIPGSVIASNISDAEVIAEKIGFPVVMKIASPDILHKSDFGGVRVGIQNKEDVRRTFVEMKERAKRLLPDADVWGVSIQEMIEGGKEVILGMVRDPQFGPVIMFGLGGIYVEVLKDVSFRIAPLTVEDANAMIREIRSLPLLQGARGERATDLEGIVESLLRLSQMVTDFPEIFEIDINPLKAFPEGRPPMALDARLTVSKNEV
jgi:acetyltransferase